MARKVFNVATTQDNVRKHPLANCEECPLKDAAYVPTSGPADAKVAFVSRSPGKHDVYKGVPWRTIR